MMRSMVAATLAALLVACSEEASGPADMPRTALELGRQEIVSVQNAYSGFDTPARQVITTEAQWAQAWSRMHNGMTPVPPAPVVDFSRDWVLLAAMGAKPSTGHSVAITEARVHGNILYVRVVERTPGAGCVTGDAITAPVHVVSVPKQAGVSQFIVQRQTVQC